jgi:YD repeat-containing protein
LPGVSGDAGSGSQSFSYDELNRLTGSSGLASGLRGYTYDLDGNRVSNKPAGRT